MGVNYGDLRMSVLEWVDDVITFAKSTDQQNFALRLVNEFAIKHRLNWGKEKCKVTEANIGPFIKRQWKLRQDEIETCDSYKYSG